MLDELESLVSRNSISFSMKFIISGLFRAELWLYFVQVGLGTVSQPGSWGFPDYMQLGGESTTQAVPTTT